MPIGLSNGSFFPDNDQFVAQMIAPQEESQESGSGVPLPKPRPEAAPKPPPTKPDRESGIKVESHQQALSGALHSEDKMIVNPRSYEGDPRFIAAPPDKFMGYELGTKPYFPRPDEISAPDINPFGQAFVESIASGNVEPLLRYQAEKPRPHGRSILQRALGLQKPNVPITPKSLGPQ